MSHRRGEAERRYLWLRGIDFDNLMMYIKKATLDFNNPKFQWDMKGVESGVQWIYFDSLSEEEMQLMLVNLRKFLEDETEKIKELGIYDLYDEMLKLIVEEINERKLLKLDHNDELGTEGNKKTY